MPTPKPLPFSFVLRDTHEVPRCTILTGIGTAPRRDVVVLLVFDGSVRFGNVLTFTGKGWHAEVEIGAEKDAGHQFTLAVYNVPPEVADEWAAQLDIPLAEVPDLALGTVTVIRNDESEPC